MDALQLCELHPQTPRWTQDTEMLPPTLKPWFAVGFKFKKLRLEQSHLWIPSFVTLCNAGSSLMREAMEEFQLKI